MFIKSRLYQHELDSQIIFLVSTLFPILKKISAKKLWFYFILCTIWCFPFWKYSNLFMTSLKFSIVQVLVFVVYLLRGPSVAWTRYPQYTFLLISCCLTFISILYHRPKHNIVSQHKQLKQPRKDRCGRSLSLQSYLTLLASGTLARHDLIG